MAGMGPPPKHPDQRRRRNATVPMVQLPAEGRKGEAPQWPLSRAKAAEAAVWAELWTTPQAVAWERLGWTREVARYVRYLVAAEKPNPESKFMTEARQLADRLGLTPLAMLRLRWEIVSDEVDDARTAHTGAESTRRLRAVDPTATNTASQ